MHGVAGNDDDVRVEAYKAARTHEVVLTEATASFEQAALAPLIVLNGGAVVALLTLLGVLLGKDSGRHPQPWLSAFAILAWGIGLVAAALATHFASNRLSNLSVAQRIMREGVEDSLYPADFAEILGGSVPDEDFDVSLFSETDRDKRQVRRIKIRRLQRQKATKNAQRLQIARSLSVAMFVLGAGLALGAVLDGGNVSLTKPTASSRAVTHDYAAAGAVTQALEVRVLRSTTRGLTSRPQQRFPRTSYRHHPSSME